MNAISKYKIIRYYINGKAIDESEFNTIEELYKIPMIMQYISKDNFKQLRWNSIYGMPSCGPHVSILELCAEYNDGSYDRICNINEIEGLGLEMVPFGSNPTLPLIETEKYVKKHRKYVII